RVPAGNLIGAENMGFACIMGNFQSERLALALMANMTAQMALEESLEWAAQREAFGKPIAGFQSIAFMIADMDARAETARAMWRHAAALMNAGLPFKKEAAIAKLVAGDAAMQNARAATQIHGGYGFMNEFPVARHYRDSKILEVGEGTSEVQRMVIARELGLPS
ncbi:MAG: acyl-CoA dehydrogenase, partial [Actinobacteria bacterium]|nr:acyl-CoA dehydrogenase [Actinomycetota bacterium]